MPELDLFRLSKGAEKYALLGKELGNDAKDFLMDVGGFASKSFNYAVSDGKKTSTKIFEFVKSKVTTKNLIVAGTLTAISIPVIRYFV